MDSVPFVFSERVLATRKCCERFSCSCSNHRFDAQTWNHPEKVRTSFHLSLFNGKWRYDFCDARSSKSLSLDEVMRLKNVRVIQCAVWGVGLLKHDVVDMEKLLNVVSFLSNEPSLYVYKEKDDFSCSQGQKVFKWLAESWFSYVYVPDLTPLRCQIIENQFSRWKPTPITIGSVHENAAFVENRLMSGDLRRFNLRESYEFPSAVLVRIIQNVLEAPEDYRTNGLDIDVYFDDSARELMNEMAESGRCRREGGDGHHYKYIFDSQAPVLKVDNLYEHRWKLGCVVERC